MLTTQEFNFTPVIHGNNVTIHKGGMKIDVEVDRSGILSLVSQLSDKDRYELMESMKVMGNSC